MGDGGKGSAPRPMSVKYEDFANSFDRIFGKKKSNPDLSVYDNERLVTNYDKELLAKNQCYCYNCNKDRLDESGRLPYTMTRMIVCPTCGNKRCPHSTDHNMACTNSNDPGQPGSRY
jgi:hypothetical protein